MPPQYKPKVYRKRGGSEQVVASGGTYTIESGGTLAIASGATWSIGGTAVTATAAEINTISTQEEFTADTGGVAANDIAYVSGYDAANTRIKLKKAQADAAGTSADLYWCPDAVTAASSGNAKRHGYFTSTLTNSGSVGDPVYLSDSSAGAITGTKPTGTDVIKEVGTFITTGANAVVNIDLGGEEIQVHDHSTNAQGGTLASIAGLTGTTETTFTFDSNSSAGKIAMTVVGGGTDNTVTLSNTATTGDITLTFPDATGTFVTETGGQIQSTITDLTNVQHDHSNAANGGTLSTPALTGTTSNTFDVDSDNASGVLQLKTATGGTSNTVTLTNSTTTADRTITLPDADDTLVGKATTDTLTNKTLSGGALVSGLTITNITVTGTWTNLGTVTTADINGGSIDGATLGAASAVTITDMDCNGGSIDGVTIGAAVAPTVTDLGSVATCDINGGAIDGVTIGAASAGAITGTTLTAADATTPTIATATGKTNTGTITVAGKTSGSFILTTNDSTAQSVTLTPAAQTAGATILTIVDMAGNNANIMTTGYAGLTQTVLGTLRADDINLGASGAAGVLEIFPSTGASGKIQISPQDNAADHTIDIQNASFGQAVTLTIPDPGNGTASFVLNKGTNTISSTDTHTGVLDVSGATVTYRSIVNADVSASAAIARSKLAQDALKPYAVDLTSLRVWDAIDTNLPGTPLTDDLGITNNTWATGGSSILTEDHKAAGAQNNYAYGEFVLPAEYDAGETVTLRFRAHAKTTAADTSMTLDVVVYKADTEAGIGADLASPTPQSINNTAWSNYDFTVDPTGLTAGDRLVYRVHTAVNDGATGTAVIAEIGDIRWLLDVRG